MKQALLYISFIALLAACKNEANNEDTNITTTSAIPAPQNLSYNVVASYPHDTSSYTQGLIWIDNTLYEGTGQAGFSKLLKVDLKSGKALQQIDLPAQDFGEGITKLGDKIYQLTYTSNKVYVYDAKTFKKLQEFAWPHEGWGITNTGTDLIISTGSNNLYFVDPATFKIKNIVGVFDNNGPVGNLNELEFIDGQVYANVYTSDYIIRIDPSSGHVTGRMNFEGLLQKSGKSVEYGDGNVLNGIAYDSAKNVMYITGKKWPLLFEVKVN